MSMMIALMAASLSHMASVTGMEGDICTISMCVMLMKGSVVSMCGGEWGVGNYIGVQSKITWCRVGEPVLRVCSALLGVLFSVLGTQVHCWG